jgi:hypothetical protein
MELVNIKHICTDTSGGASRVWWYPYGNNRLKVAQGGIEFLHGANIYKRLVGLIKFLANLFKKPGG